MPIPRLSPVAYRLSLFAICLVGLILAVIGYFGVWVPHKTAALTRTGFELAEFAKLFPQVQGGTVPINRTLFFTPPIAAAILLGLLTNQPANKPTKPIVHLIFLLPAILLVLAALPPYQSLRDSQYRSQLILAAGGLLLTLLTPLAHTFPRRYYGILVAFLALGGIVPALWQLALFHPLVAALYGGPPGLGWGLVACTAGFVLLLVCGILDAVARKQGG